ncbi:hypothetical protein CAPTEDRAFT_154863 [Capitella teleta]|uniref:EF-hand domain-containing protein n=1 Tax=Capitella teleta TaxID=283909 RepID=R7T924_CAPTE|nr:hypothetical protein CAPTEDRAFT_154863 [Capitella teleta]|eukprot:ELT90233.1 hypothetical protein CAPTEDRAFT_154863 [Capitella teleta]
MFSAKLLVEVFSLSVLALMLLVHRSNAQAQPPAHLRDKINVQDHDHIVEHLDGVVDQQAEYSEEEMQFHYFKAHDYDNNNKLDGIELISALTHYHKEAEQKDEGEESSVMSDFELMEMVDDIMQQEDGNDDGYIDYVEFLRSQGREVTQGGPYADPVLS